MIGDSVTSKRCIEPSGAGSVRIVDARSERAAGAAATGSSSSVYARKASGRISAVVPPPSEVGGVPDTGSQTSANAAGGSNIAPASTSSASEPFIPRPPR